MSTPFDLVYDSLWQTLLVSPSFRSLVREGNRIRFDSDSDRSPMKDNVLTADTPEMVLSVESTSQINLHRTSCTSSLTRRYAWLLSTGDQRAQRLLFPIEWAVFCAMNGFKETLCALKWNGLRFVKDVRVSDATAGLSDPARNRGIIGFSSVWRVDVDMHFATTDLLAELE